MLRTRDNWERLVGAVLKKQQLWELFHAHSRSPSELSEATSSADLSSLSFREIDTSSTNWQQPEYAVSVSDFVQAFDRKDPSLNSLEALGTGTFGNTYVVDVSDGVKMVVKVINESINFSEEQFKRSMDVVARVRHENVVALRAYHCSEHGKLMMYDYYSQGSVYQLLHGQTNVFRPRVSWETRLRIAIGAARGLASIHVQHAGKLIHGNIKSTNIFINHEDYGSISDFGMINLIASKFRQKEFFHAPEVKNTQNVSQESDVYSFGILLFELLTRKPSVQVLGGPDAVDLVKLMKSGKSKNKISKIFDAHLLEDPTIREQMVRVLHIGISCVVKSVKKRPKMSEVVKMLEDLYYTAERPMFDFFNPNSQSEDGFDLDDLLRASADILRKGTFGSSSEGFYKVCFENGSVVRVKIMNDVNVSSKEFKHHMDIIGSIKHQSCAELKAYYFSKDETLLVYDFFNNENLSDLLHGKLGYREPLHWGARFYLALTAAKGIAHIHGLDGSTLVHGSIKSSNIFVNGDNNAIITDTALWKVRKPIRSSELRHKCYLAPEVVKDTKNLSQASDVYSFGVVLLELLTRRSPQETGSDEEEVISLVSLVRDHVARDLASTVLDPELQGCDAMKNVLKLAMDCVEDAPQRRPAMSAVVKRLEMISGICEEESEPSMRSDSEDVTPWIGSSILEDASEIHLSSLAILQRYL